MSNYKMIVYERMNELSKKLDKAKVELYIENNPIKKKHIEHRITTIETALHFNEALYWDTGEVQ
jgi:hypothetical protein